MKRICILSLLLCFLLSGCITVLPGNTDSTASGTNDASAADATAAQTATGWVKQNGKTYYIHPDGSRHTGWLELDGTRYYLADNGVLQTGWLKLDDKEYYLKADGSITRGKATINQSYYYFTSQGVKTILVNPWNMMPMDYEPYLFSVEGGHKVDYSCKDALEQMLADCRAAGYDPAICSSYRTQALQIELYNKKVNYFLDLGYDAATARKEAGKIIAVPGTSEHQLGLAVDLVDNAHWDLDESQEKRPTQQWLMEHCWEYGFILRYPTGKTEYTGIIYEPWHYRYVGVELAMELKDSGLCLEDYFASLS